MRPLVSVVSPELRAGHSALSRTDAVQEFSPMHVQATEADRVASIYVHKGCVGGLRTSISMYIKAVTRREDSRS
jgi:hypothetical protein